MEETNLVIHTDGGSRGNPGPAASAFIVEKGGEIFFKGSKYLGKVTNNFAEYTGVVLALQWIAKEFPVSNFQFPIVFILDSELVVRQLNGVYKVRDENLQKLFAEVKSLIAKIDSKIIFKNVPREENTIADQLVNEELDRNIS